MTVAVFASDTHLSNATWSSRNQIVGDSLWGFRQLVELALQVEAPLVIAGDCWELWREPNPDASVVKVVRELLDRMEQKRVPLFFINGQHDNLSPPYWFNAIHTWPVYVGQSVFLLGGKKYYGIDFFESSSFEQVKKTIPSDTYGLVLHQAWLEFAGSKLLATLSLADLPRVQLVVSGDMHKLMHVIVDKTVCVSPGSTHMRAIREPRQHFAVLLDEKGNLSQYQLKSRAVLDYTVTHHSMWLHDFENFRKRVAEVFGNQRGIVPLEVAKPLVIVTDPFGAGAGAAIEEELQDCHVIVRQTGTQSDLLDTTDVRLTGTGVEQLLEDLLRKSELTEQQRELVSQVVSGKDILAYLDV